MGLDEHAGDADRDRRARQYGHEFALPARGAAEPAGLLHGMGGVKNHRRAGLRQNRQRAHVGHQRIVAERDAALGDEHVARARVGEFRHDILHVPRRKELPLLDIHRPPRSRGGDEEVGLAAKEGRDLQHVDGLRGERALRDLVHVGQHGQAEAVPDFGEHGKRGFEPKSPRGPARSAVGLVERSLEHEADLAARGDLLQGAGDFERVRARFEQARAGDERERQVGAEGGGLRAAADADVGVGGHGGDSASGDVESISSDNHLVKYYSGRSPSSTASIHSRTTSWFSLMINAIIKAGILPSIDLVVTYRTRTKSFSINGKPYGSLESASKIGSNASSISL